MNTSGFWIPTFRFNQISNTLPFDWIFEVIEYFHTPGKILTAQISQGHEKYLYHSEQTNMDLLLEMHSHSLFVAYRIYSRPHATTCCSRCVMRDSQSRIVMCVQRLVLEGVVWARTFISHIGAQGCSEHPIFCTLHIMHSEQENLWIGIVPKLVSAMIASLRFFCSWKLRYNKLQGFHRKWLIILGSLKNNIPSAFNHYCECASCRCSCSYKCQDMWEYKFVWPNAMALWCCVCVIGFCRLFMKGKGSSFVYSITHPFFHSFNFFLLLLASLLHFRSILLLLCMKPSYVCTTQTSQLWACHRP